MSGLLHALGAQAMNAAPALRPAATQHAPVPPREPLLEEGFEEVVSFGESQWEEGARVAAVKRSGRELRSDAAMAPFIQADRKRSDDLHASRVADSQAASHHEDALPPTFRDEVDDDTAATRPPMRVAPTLQPRQRAFPIAAPRLPSPRDPTAGITTPQQPDVHIHIGRIEVIAPAPAAPPKRERPAPAHKSVSLEDYLRKGAKPP